MFFGGMITPDINNAPGLQNHVNETHRINLSETFAKIAGSEMIEVNFYHNQGIQVDQVADNLSIIASHPGDNLVEGLRTLLCPSLLFNGIPSETNHTIVLILIFSKASALKANFGTWTSHEGNNSCSRTRIPYGKSYGPTTKASYKL